MKNISATTYQISLKHSQYYRPVLPAPLSELASATYRNLSSPLRPGEVAFDIVGQKFHGACAVGGSVYEAFEHMERLEHVCKIYLASGINLNGI